MGWADGLGQVLQNVLGGNASETDIHSAFDKVSGAVPHGALAEGISHVFNSDQTPPFEQMLAQAISPQMSRRWRARHRRSTRASWTRSRASTRRIRSW